MLIALVFSPARTLREHLGQWTKRPLRSRLRLRAGDSRRSKPRGKDSAPQPSQYANCEQRKASRLGSLGFVDPMDRASRVHFLKLSECKEVRVAVSPVEEHVHAVNLNGIGR